MKKFADFMQDQLRDPEVKKEFQRLEPYFNLAREVMHLRKKKGLTQKELAEKISSTQAVISRIENGSANCTIETLQKIGEALDAVLDVHLESTSIHDKLQEWLNEPGLLSENSTTIRAIPDCQSISQSPAWEINAVENI